MKVLLIEDDVVMGQMYVNMLKAENFEVEVAVDGEQALAKLTPVGDWPSLILLDVMMPKMDGLTLLEKLNKDSRFKDISVVILTNMYDEEAKKKARDLGAKDFFIKSEQDPKELMDKIKGYIKA